MPRKMRLLGWREISRDEDAAMHLTNQRNSVSNTFILEDAKELIIRMIRITAQHSPIQVVSTHFHEFLFSVDKTHNTKCDEHCTSDRFERRILHKLHCFACGS